MKNALLFLLFFAFTSIYSQNTIVEKDTLKTKKNNIILYADATFGGAFLEDGGFYTGLSLYYQKNKHLFKLGTSTTIDINGGFFPVAPLLFLPFSEVDNETNSFSFSYGRRHIDGGFSYSYTGGIALVKSKKLLNENTNNNNNIKYSNSSHIGFPLEFNIKWFKNRKERFRALYGLIPVGKPTSFGRAIGFKFTANISKTPYIGIGLTYGFGFHKNYN